ncbi:CYTH domain-containing protein [Rhizobium herbae]|jgi:adenylate cyclase
MAAEIERKYLVLNDSWRRHASQGAAFCQAYLTANKNRFVRIRTIDTVRAVLTVKFRTGPLRREEFEYDIPYIDALEMIAYATAVLEKTRYEVRHLGYVWEIDVYSGVNDGLVLAEIELGNEADQPPRPPWLGPEVTGISAYSNRTLAAFPHPDELLMSAQA